MLGVGHTMCCVVLLFCAIMVFLSFLWYLLTLIPLRMDEYEAGMDVRMSEREERNELGWASPRASGFTPCTIIILPALHCTAVDGTRLLDLGWKATGLATLARIRAGMDGHTRHGCFKVG